jgi:hypothetical protein
MQPQYEWDEDKARINLRKHQVSFQKEPRSLMIRSLLRCLILTTRITSSVTLQSGALCEDGFW